MDAVALTSILLSSAAWAQEKIKVGVTATLEGTYTILAWTASPVSTPRSRNTARRRAAKSLNRHRLDRRDARLGGARGQEAHRTGPRADLDSPLSGDEGIAVKNFSKTYPELTFINAASGAQETTFPDPLPNFFRCNMDGAHGLLDSATMLTTPRATRRSQPSAKIYSFVYTQVFGLVLEFCAAGGR